jgi:hypothetical protein
MPGVIRLCSCSLRVGVYVCVVMCVGVRGVCVGVCEGECDLTVYDTEIHTHTPAQES